MLEPGTPSKRMAKEHRTLDIEKPTHWTAVESGGNVQANTALSGKALVP